MGNLPTHDAIPPDLTLASYIFQYQEQHRIIVCQPCQCVVVDTQIHRHLRLYHQSQKGCPELRHDDVLAHFKRYPDRIPHISELVLPSRLIPPIPGLPIYHGCFLCPYPGCRWITRESRRVQEHCRRKHTPLDPPIDVFPRRTTAAQQLTSSGPGSQYFPVLVDETVETSNAPESPATAARPPSPAQPPFSDKPSAHERTTSPDRAPTALTPEMTAPPVESTTAELTVSTDLAAPAPGNVSAVTSVPLLHSPSQERKSIRQLRALVHDWMLVCPHCRTRQKPPEKQRHSLQDCDRPGINLIHKEITRITTRIGKSSPLDGICPFCHLPDILCRPLDGPRDSPCVFDGIIIGALASLLRNDVGRCERDLFPWMEKEQVNLQSAQAVYQWIIQPIQWDGMTIYRFVFIFYRVFSTDNVFL